MAFIFGGKKAKSPQELVKKVKELYVAVEKNAGNEKNVQKFKEELSKELATMKIYLYGEPEHEPNQETITAVTTEVISQEVLPLLVTELGRLEFEAKKDVSLIFNNLLRRQVGDRFVTVEYLNNNPPLLAKLVNGYTDVDIALHCGAMLRDITRHESLVKLILQSSDNLFWKFFEFIEMVNFDVASDAFTTFKELLTKHKALVAEFLEKNYDRFFELYTSLLKSENYVTKRQSLKLLGELLLDRANFNVMTRYISSQDNLKLMMILLKHKSASIQFEAFHVFKVFVANPNKTQAVLDILVRNRERLISFLSNFQNDKEDEQFNDEKAFLLKQIEAL
eukprot:TRINITY_DN1382_c0_g1_i1.p1 TRINITY_DN1382_c0_g1~~TRINITY_DN1382_c0_g1_i1.p1  ORF type:complete len:363 (-),score=102.87 TRINITY_DN1382_c0_g1_i1:252-1259(-)